MVFHTQKFGLYPKKHDGEPLEIDQGFASLPLFLDTWHLGSQIDGEWAFVMRQHPQNPREAHVGVGK